MNVRSSSTCVWPRLLDGVQVDFHTVADRERQALPPRHGRRLFLLRLHGVEVAPALLRGGADRFAAAAHLFVAACLWLPGCPGCAVLVRSRRALHALDRPISSRLTLPELTSLWLGHPLACKRA